MLAARLRQRWQQRPERLPGATARGRARPAAWTGLRRALWVVPLAGMLALAGCGFQLRGSANLPFDTVFVNTAVNSPLGNEIKRNIRAGTATAVIDDPKAAAAQFQLLSEVRGKEILSYNSAGRVREYRLLYTVRFQVTDGKGRDFIPATTIALRREISFNESAILANDAEEGLMYRDMQSDVVQQILRRMAAIKVG